MNPEKLKKLQAQAAQVRIGGKVSPASCDAPPPLPPAVAFQRDNKCLPA